MNFAALHPHLEVHRITIAAVPAAYAFPQRTEIVQQGVSQGVHSKPCQIESQTRFVQGSARSVGRNLRLPSQPFLVKEVLSVR